MLLQLFFLCNISSIAQSFELDQLQQMLRPKLKADFSFLPQVSDHKNNVSYSSNAQSFLFTVPLKTKLGADISLDLSSLNLKDIIKNSVSVKASQLLASGKIGARQIHISNETKNIYHVYGGVFGLKLTKKFKVTFYSVNAGYSEQDKTLNQIRFRMNGVIGNFKLLGLRKNYYYGVSAIWSDGVFIPIPFFGGNLPINERLLVSFTIPAQAYLQYNLPKRQALSAGFTFDGYRTGLKIINERTNFNYLNLNLFLNYRIRMNNTFGLRLQGGYVAFHQINYQFGSANFSNSLKPGFYVEAGISTFFGRSLWDQVNGTLSDVLSNLGNRD